MKKSFIIALPLILVAVGACVEVQSAPPATADATPPPPPSATGPTGATPESTATPPAPSATTPAPSTTGAPTTGGSAGTPAPSGGSERLLGVWTSPSCGARTYARTLQFDRGSAFEAQDLVSPCPPKVQCIWSGIVGNKGTYAVEGNTLRLTVTQPGSNAKAQPLPTSLGVDPTTSAPVETAGATKCVYVKGAPVPPTDQRGAPTQIETKKPAGR